MTSAIDSSTYALDVVDAIDLLVLRVRAVVTRADRQQHHVLAGRLLQGQGHRNASALTRQVGLDAEH